MFKDHFKEILFVSGDVPTSEELDLFKESWERVDLVVRARWFVLGILAAYGMIPYIFFQHSSADIAPINSLHCIVPVIAWSFVAIYNAFFHFFSRRFANIRPLNQIQLLLDLFFVTVVVHFSGGGVSWFWTMYMVLTLEAAMIMENGSDTYAIALGGALAYGGLLMFEHNSWILPVQMPFENNHLQRTISYEIIKWAWVSATNLCVACIGVSMMKTVRSRETQLRQLVIKDFLTSLYNRRYFFYRLNSEVQRAKRYKRTLSLLILDVDDFKKFNDRYGHLAGDEVLRATSHTILTNIRRRQGKESYEVDIACRYGGEEMAVILPETNFVQGASAAERLRGLIETRCRVAVAEALRKDHEKIFETIPEVTVSIGVASYPEHANEPEDLIKAADKAMFEAKNAGKNQVCVATNYPASLPVGEQYA